MRDIVGRERVIAGTDCGFGSFAGYSRVDPAIAYKKLRSARRQAPRSRRTSYGETNVRHPARDGAEPTAAEVRAALERILRSRCFEHAGRASDFLRFVVGKTLAGEADRLKGYTIADQRVRPPGRLRRAGPIRSCASKRCGCASASPSTTPAKAPRIA